MVTVYRGKYPDRIRSISAQRDVRVMTNSGAIYWSDATRLRGVLPDLGQELDLLFWSFSGQSSLYRMKDV